MFKRKSLASQIWKLKGSEFGPSVLIMGGTHGDELAGVETVRRVLNHFGVLNQPGDEFETTKLRRGALFLGFGNPEAILRRTRFAQGPRDLNRWFIPEDLDVPVQQDDSLDLRRARELRPLLESVDVLLDLHASGNPTVPFACSSRTSKLHFDLLRLLPVEHFLTDPNSVLPTEFKLNSTGTTDYYVNTYGGGEWSERQYGRRQGVGLCYETGQDNDLSVVPMVLKVVVRLLHRFDMLDDTFSTDHDFRYEEPPSIKQITYTLEQAVIAQESGFHYKPGMDRSWVQVTAGQILGHYSSGRPEVIPRDGVLVMPKFASKVIAGRKFYFIANRIG